MEQEMVNDVAEALPVTQNVPAEEAEENAAIAPAEVNAPAEADELSALREALAKTEKALAEKEKSLAAVSAQQEKYAAEFAAFRKEFPEVALGKVTDEVWEDVKRGVPLAAAYALAEHRAAKKAGANGCERGVWHSLSGGTDEGLFSPSEVRAMTQCEVRRHYDRILESMKRW